jgi:integrase/recombinase XerD
MRTTGAVKGMRAKAAGQDANETETSGGAVTPEEIARFIEGLPRQGYTGETVKRYKHSLDKLWAYLPEDKQLERDTLPQWREALLAEGYAVRTVNLFISAANSFLEHVNLREYQLGSQMRPEEDVQPELTRTEYLRLLQAARTLGRERTYLLVKLFGTTGLPLQELPKVTVEAVQAGAVTVASCDSRQVLHLPGCLREELLDYAGRMGRRSGPIFVTKKGTPMSRTNVSAGIRQLCGAARVPEEKGNPRCLRKLYLSTHAGIEANISLLVEQAYNRLLETEQLSIAWGG